MIIKCTKDLVMDLVMDRGYIAFTKGNTYNIKIERCQAGKRFYAVQNDMGEPHVLSEDEFDFGFITEHFRRI